MKPLKPRTGSPAEGPDYFFHRKKIISKLIRAITNKENINISAPRRTGKSSILKFLSSNPGAGRILKYIIVQSADSSERFYKTAFNALIDDDDIYGVAERIWRKGNLVVKEYMSKIRGLSSNGINFSENAKLDYCELFKTLLKQLSIHEKQVVIVFDEFPDAINNIYTNDKSEAKKFLQEHREYRELYQGSSVLFIYTGSTGLQNVVRKIGEMHLINNLKEIKISPFSLGEAIELIKRLILGYQEDCKDFTINDETIKYMLDKINWLLPYYIQIVMERVYENYLENKITIAANCVDDAINEIVRYNSEYSAYFENWKTRLSTAFSDQNDYKLAVEFLNQVSVSGSIHKRNIDDLAIKYGVEDVNQVIDILCFDGYIDVIPKTKEYSFNSVLLKEWWIINVAT